VKRGPNAGQGGKGVTPPEVHGFFCFLCWRAAVARRHPTVIIHGVVGGAWTRGEIRDLWPETAACARRVDKAPFPAAIAEARSGLVGACGAEVSARLRRRHVIHVETEHLRDDSLVVIVDRPLASVVSG